MLDERRGQPLRLCSPGRCNMNFCLKTILMFLLPSLFDIPLYHTMSWKDEEMERVADIIVEEALRLPN